MKTNINISSKLEMGVNHVEGLRRAAAGIGLGQAVYSNHRSIGADSVTRDIVLTNQRRLDAMVHDS